MKVLCLYANECAEELWDWLDKQGHTTVRFKNKLDDNWVSIQDFELAVSYTYPYIIKQSIIDILNGNIVNLHTSFLPFNRGSYPNIWSIIDGTPRGVTLHYIDEGLDSGDMISQVLVPLEIGATLQSSYDQLDHAGKELFKNCFEYYEYWDSMRKKVCGTGTFHRDKEFMELREHFSHWDWNMPIDIFAELLGIRGKFNDKKS